MKPNLLPAFLKYRLILAVSVVLEQFFQVWITRVFRHLCSDSILQNTARFEAHGFYLVEARKSYCFARVLSMGYIAVPEIYYFVSERFEVISIQFGCRPQALLYRDTAPLVQTNDLLRTASNSGRDRCFDY